LKWGLLVDYLTFLLHLIDLFYFAAIIFTVSNRIRTWCYSFYQLSFTFFSFVHISWGTYQRNVSYKYQIVSQFKRI